MVVLSGQFCGDRQNVGEKVALASGWRREEFESWDVGSGGHDDEPTSCRFCVATKRLIDGVGDSMGGLELTT